MNHKMAMLHILLFVCSLLSGNRCVSSSLLTGIKRQNMEQNSLMATLQNDLLRQLLNQETIIRLSMSKTIGVMRNDIATMQKTIADIKEENRQFKNQVAENEKQMTNKSNTLKQQLQTELKTVKEENLLLKEQLSEYVKQITHINTTLKQQFQTELGTLKKEIPLFKKQFSEYKKQTADFNITLEQMRKMQKKLLAEAKTHNGEIENLNTEDKLLKEKSSEYEKQFNNINVTLEQIQKKHFFHVTETNITTRDIQDACIKNELLLRKQRVEYEKDIADINVTLIEMQKYKDILNLENNSHKKKISTLEKELAGFNSSINKVTKKLFPPYTAFHAVLMNDQGVGVIVFKQVLTNIGNAYDRTTGVFVALSDGTFIFSWSVETYGIRTDTVLEVNRMVKGRVTADESSSYYDTSTSFAVLELQEGDAVNIRVKSGKAKSTRTMFSGWHYNSSDFNAGSIVWDDGDRNNNNTIWGSAAIWSL